MDGEDEGKKGKKKVKLQMTPSKNSTFAITTLQIF